MFVILVRFVIPVSVILVVHCINFQICNAYCYEYKNKPLEGGIAWAMARAGNTDQSLVGKLGRAAAH